MTSQGQQGPYDVLVLGGGSGGYACALRAAEVGLRVGLVERDLLGGTCLHRGCIPTKAILHAAEVADAARSGSRYGVHATIDRIDLAGVTAYAAGVVSRLHRGLTGLVRSRGIDLLPGEGRLVTDDEAGGAGAVPAVEVAGVRHRAPHLVLATGSSSRSLPGLEVDGRRVLTSDHAIRLETLPGSAVVLGGGVIGVELASAWRSFGVEVTVVEAQPRLLPTEEPSISAALQRAYAKRGVGLRLGTAVADCEVGETGVRVTLADGEVLATELLLVAVGRGPRTAGLGFAEAGVALDRGAVVVDERLQTTVPGVYAVGDLVPGLQLAHRGFAHGIFVAEEIARRLGRTDRAPVPVVDRDIPR